jgi:hypothetical protein
MKTQNYFRIAKADLKGTLGCEQENAGTGCRLVLVVGNTTDKWLYVFPLETYKDRDKLEKWEIFIPKGVGRCKLNSKVLIDQFRVINQEEDVFHYLGKISKQYAQEVAAKFRKFLHRYDRSYWAGSIVEYWANGKFRQALALSSVVTCYNKKEDKTNKRGLFIDLQNQNYIRTFDINYRNIRKIKAIKKRDNKKLYEVRHYLISLIEDNIDKFIQ